MNGQERRIRILVDGLGAVLCALAAALTLADVSTPIRSGLTVAMLVLGTGWAATTWIRTRDAATAGTVAIGTGIGIVCCYALVFVEVHWWHPIGSVGGILIVAALVNLGAAVFHLRGMSGGAAASGPGSGPPRGGTEP